MATYFPSSNNDRDAPPMNYMREAGGSYSEAPVLPGMMMYMNYASSSGSYSDTFAANSQQQNTCVDIPQSGASDSNVSHHEFLSNLGGSRVSEHDFSAWRDARSEMMLMQPMGGASNFVHGGQNLQGQGLSLSLSPQIPSGIRISSMQYRNPNPGYSSILGPNASISGDDVGRNGSYRDDETSQSKQLRNIEYVQPDVPGSGSDFMKGDVSPYVMSNITRTIPSSKYLKAAQQLLDEVVNVRTALKQQDCKKDSMKDPKEVDGASKGNALDSSNAQESSSNAPTELSASEKQEVQNKMSKLLSMLDEVDRRYRQYFHQMQIVVSSFDVIAGCGAAKPYTALALQTISRHFRCLRDAINGQIRVTQRSLGEQDGSANNKGVGISRLRYVDQQLRQQRALQQLGMMQQHTWRPQRGLPESSVTILRAWLFEHFLHPYPKDSDKIMLARQTGLTRSQVSNWFINARVRLWKPMVEEMYKEEAGDVEMDSNSSSDIAPKAMKGDQKIFEDGGEDLQNTATSTATEQRGTGQFFQPKPRDAPDVEMLEPSSESSFRIASHGETETQYQVGKLRGDQTESIALSEAMAQQNERFMAAYHMSELGRIGNRGGVSLTLGLQNCEDGSIPMPAGNHYDFITMRGEDVYDTTAPSLGNETVDFDCLGPVNQQNRFGSSHMLHDFVA